MNGPLFILGWLAGLVVAGTIVAERRGPGRRQLAGLAASWVKVALGALLRAGRLSPADRRNTGGGTGRVHPPRVTRAVRRPDDDPC